MASASKHRPAAATNRTLTPVMTLKGHEDSIPSVSYFPDGQKMVSGSWDNTVRQWDLQSGKEIEEARDVGKHMVRAVMVSRDGRWVISAGGDANSRRVEIKACEVETGLVKRFQTNTEMIICIDISVDNVLLASGSMDDTVQIWNFDTGKLVAGPFESADLVGAVRLSYDSKKLAVNSPAGISLEVWDVETKTLDVRIGKPGSWDWTYMPILLWTNRSNTIIAAFTFTNAEAKTIYEFDGSTLETVGAPFEGHTEIVRCLALSSDGALLASAADDHTIKLWAFGTRQLLASFDVQHPHFVVLSPDARQLAYTKYVNDDRDLEICICDNPPDVLATIGISPKAQSTPKKTSTTLKYLLQSDATRRPAAARRNPAMSSATSFTPRRPPTIEPQQPILFHLRKLLRLSSGTSAVPPVRNDRPRNPLDVPATMPLPSPLPGQATTRFDDFEISSPPGPSNGVMHFLQQHLSFLTPRHSHGPPVAEVAAGRKFTRLAAAKLPEYRKVDDTRHPSRQQPGAPQNTEYSDTDSLPDVHWCKAFLCYYSCWSHGRLRAPPRWRLERVDIRQDSATTSNRAPAHGGS